MAGTFFPLSLLFVCLCLLVFLCSCVLVFLCSCVLVFLFLLVCPGTRSQTWHLYDNDGKGNQLLVQYVARYKHLKEHLKDVCKVGHRFGVSKEFCNKDTQKKVNEQLKTMPNEDHDQTMKYFSSERVNLWDIVNDAFSNDFDKLGYAKVHSVEEYERIYVNGVLGPIVKE
jgi:hypothetical protein